MSDADEQVAAGKVLDGLRLYPLPDKVVPVEVLAIMKCVDSDGRQSWFYRASSPPNLEELLGVLTALREVTLRRLLPLWEDDDE